MDQSVPIAGHVDSTLSLPSASTLEHMYLKLVNYKDGHQERIFVDPSFSYQPLNFGQMQVSSSESQVVYFRGVASGEVYLNALRSLNYTNEKDTPTTGERLIIVAISNGATLTTAAISLSVTIRNAVPNVFVSGGLDSFASTYFPLKGPVSAISPLQAKVEDTDSRTIKMATVQLSNVRNQGYESLTVTYTSPDQLSLPVVAEAISLEKQFGNLSSIGQLVPSIMSTVFVPEVGVVGGVTVIVDIRHSWVGDLKLELEHIQRKETLVLNPGGLLCARDDLYHTAFDADASSNVFLSKNSDSPGLCRLQMQGLFSPDGNLRSFYGEPMEGAWHLHISDLLLRNDNGRLVSWGIVIQLDEMHALIFRPPVVPLLVLTERTSPYSQHHVKDVLEDGRIMHVTIHVQVGVPSTATRAYLPQITLRHPDGSEVVLTDSSVPLCARGNFSYLIFDDRARGWKYTCEEALVRSQASSSSGSGYNSGSSPDLVSNFDSNSSYDLHFDSGSSLDYNHDSDLGSSPDSVTDSGSNSVSNSSYGLDSGSSSGSSSSYGPDLGSSYDSGSSSGSSSGSYPGPNSGSYPGSNSGSYPGPNSGLYPGPDSGSYPGPNSGSYPGPNSGLYPGPNSGSYPGSNSGSYPGSNSGSYPGPNSGSVRPNFLTDTAPSLELMSDSLSPFSSGSSLPLTYENIVNLNISIPTKRNLVDLLSPHTPLASLRGKTAAGKWTLLLTNPNSLPSTLLSWSLRIATEPNIDTAYDYISNTLTLSGADSAENYEKVLRSVVYDNVASEPDFSVKRLVQTVVFDGAGYSNGTYTSAQSYVTLHHIDIDLDPSDVSEAAAPGFKVTFQEHGISIPILDSEHAFLRDVTFVSGKYSLVVRLLGYQNENEEMLVWNISAAPRLMNSIKIDSQRQDYEVTITSAMEALQPIESFQSVLRTFEYINEAEEFIGSKRRVEFFISDSQMDSNYTSLVATSLIKLNATNDRPVLILNAHKYAETDLFSNEIEFVEGKGMVFLTNASAIILTDNDHNYLTSLTVTLTNPQDGENELLSANVSSTLISEAYNASSHTLFFTGQDTLDNYISVIATIAYDNNVYGPGLPGTDPRVITFSPFDGSHRGKSAVAYVTFAAVNDPPLADLNGPLDGTESIMTFIEEGASVTLIPKASFFDIDSNSLAYVEVQIVNLFNGPLETVSVMDVMQYTDPEQKLVTITNLRPITEYHNGTGTLRVSGLDSILEYETVLRTLMYINLADEPDLTPRKVSVILNDGAADSEPVFSTILIEQVNDSPYFNALASTPVRVVLAEDVPSSVNFGISVSSLADLISDDDVNATVGIVVTDLDPVNGIWEYTYGQNWNRIQTNVSRSYGLALESDPNIGVRFNPNPDFNGVASLTFVAWDRSQPGTYMDLYIDAQSHSNIDAFSSDSKTIIMIVSAVNDAPTLIGVPLNATKIQEDDRNSTGDPVYKFLQYASDVDDPYQLAIAVIGADQENGVWEFTNDEGVTWEEFGEVNETAALVVWSLPNLSRRVRFVPNLDYNGQATFQFLVWDLTILQNSDCIVDMSGSEPFVLIENGSGLFSGSGQVNGSGDLCVQSYSSNVTSMASSYPSGIRFINTAMSDSISGPFSTNSTSVTVMIDPVNDSPRIVSGMALQDIMEDTQIGFNHGTQVSNIIHGYYSDVDASPDMGLVVVETKNQYGTWEYNCNTPGVDEWVVFIGDRIDGVVIPRLSLQRATLLLSSCWIRFVPQMNFNTEIDSFNFPRPSSHTPYIQARGWDNTGEMAGRSGTHGNNASRASLSDTNEFSSTSEKISIQILSSNDRPRLFLTNSSYASYSGTFVEDMTAILAVGEDLLLIDVDHKMLRDVTITITGSMFDVYSSLGDIDFNVTLMDSSSYSSTGSGSGLYNGSETDSISSGSGIGMKLSVHAAGISSVSPLPPLQSIVSYVRDLSSPTLEDRYCSGQEDRREELLITTLNLDLESEVLSYCPFVLHVFTNPDISSMADKVQFQHALRSLQYNNLLEEPEGGDRKLTFVVSDGIDLSRQVESVIFVQNKNDPPQLDLNKQMPGLNNYVTFTEGQGPVVLTNASALRLIDYDDTYLRNANVMIVHAPDADHEFLSATVATTHIDAFYDNSSFTLYLTGNATISEYKDVLATVAYNNFYSNPGQPDERNRWIKFSVNDGEDYSIATFAIVQFNGINDRPLIDLNGNDPGVDFTTTFKEEGDPVHVVHPDAFIHDEDNTTLDFIRVTILDVIFDIEFLAVKVEEVREVLERNAYGKDKVVQITNLVPNMTYNRIAGSLTLTGLDTIEEYQLVLRMVTYVNTMDEPAVECRELTIVAGDGDLNSADVYSDVCIEAVNDSPQNNESVIKVLTPLVLEDEMDPSGVSVSDFAFDLFLDNDMPPPERGIAVISVESANGEWQYSLNGGGAWTIIQPDANIDSSLLLSANNFEQNYVRFLPLLDFNGNASMTFVGWDASDDLPAGTIRSARSRNDTDAFSEAMRTMVVVVVPMNDAPVVDITMEPQMMTILEDDVRERDSSGDDVSTVFLRALLYDEDIPDPIQHEFGVAVIGTDSRNGFWQFSVNAGGNWTDFGSTSSTNAVVLRSRPTGSNRIRFVPNKDYNGAATITYKLWDRNVTWPSGIGFINTEMDSIADTFSVGSTMARVSIEPVNDSPVLSQATLLNTIPEDFDPSINPGTQVGIILRGAMFSDIDGPGMGVAVLYVDRRNGDWQYTCDSGRRVTWHTFVGMKLRFLSIFGNISQLAPVAPNEFRATLLASHCDIRFLPSPHFNTEYTLEGTHRSLEDTPFISIRGWDMSSGDNLDVGMDTTSSPDDHTNAFSRKIVNATIQVISYNNPPVLNLDGNSLNFFTVFVEAKPPERIPNLVPIMNLTSVSLVDTDDTSLVSANIFFVAIDTIYEELTVQTSGTSLNHSVSFDSSTNKFTLTLSPVNGISAPLSDFEKSLKTLRYSNTAEEPDSTPRNIRFLIRDGTGLNFPFPVTEVSIQLINDPPQFDLGGAMPWPDSFSFISYSEREGKVSLVGGNATLIDPDDNVLQSSIIEMLDPPDPGYEILDVSSANRNITFVVLSNGSKLLISGPATVEEYLVILKHVTYEHLLSNPMSTDRSIQISVSDGKNSSIPAIINIVFTATNNRPVLDINGNQTGSNFSVVFGEEEGAMVIVSPNMILEDIDNSSLSYVEVRILNTKDGDKEVLFVEDVTETSAPLDRKHVTFWNYRPTQNYDTVTSTLRITGLDSVYEFQEVLKTLRYDNLADEPHSETRIIQFFVSDGLLTYDSVFSHVQIQNINDSPFFNSAAPRFTPSIFEDVHNLENPGWAVDDIIGSNLILDDDEEQERGIAIMDADFENGYWEVTWDFTTDVVNNSGSGISLSESGSNMNTVDPGIMPTISTVPRNTASESSGSGSGFHETGFGMSGSEFLETVSRMSGSEFLETVSRMSGSGFLGTSAGVSGSGVLGSGPGIIGSGVLGTSSGMSGSGVLGTSSEMSGSGFLGTGSGMSGSGMELADTITLLQKSPPTKCISATPFTPIHPTEMFTGTWYRLSNSTKSTMATVLRADGNRTRVRFIPFNNFEGRTKFSFKAWDVTDALRDGSQADTSSLSGTDPYSSELVQITVRVEKVNDAPVLSSMTFNLTSIVEDDVSLFGDAVSHLVEGVSDIDVSDYMFGIAVVLADEGNGLWQFSMDRGDTWSTMEGLCPYNATVISSDSLGANRIRFSPYKDFNGFVSFSFVAWDMTSGHVSGQTSIDTTKSHPVTGTFSTTRTSATLQVEPLNDSPVLVQGAALADIYEDTLFSDNKGTMVADIVQSVYYDADVNFEVGIAVIEVDSRNGNWEWICPSSESWNEFIGDIVYTVRIPFYPRPEKATLLSGNCRVRFLPNLHFNTMLDIEGNIRPSSNTPYIEILGWDNTGLTQGASGVHGIDTSYNNNSVTNEFSAEARCAVITILSVNDLSQVIISSGGNGGFFQTQYTEEQNSVRIVEPNSVSILDPDHATLVSISTILVDTFNPGMEMLYLKLFPNSSDVRIDQDSMVAIVTTTDSNGQKLDENIQISMNIYTDQSQEPTSLTLSTPSGSSPVSVEAYQVLLQLVVYTNHDPEPNKSTRQIRFFVDDGEQVNNLTSTQIKILVLNDNAPVLTSLLANVNFVEGVADLVPVSGNISLVDLDHNDCFFIVNATIKLTPIPAYADENLSTNLSSVPLAANLSQVYNPSTGMLTITGEASTSVYQSTLRTISYGNTIDEPVPGIRLILMQVHDGLQASNIQIVMVNVILVNDRHPILTTSSVPFVFTERGHPVAVGNNLTISDPDSGSFLHERVTITIMNVFDGNLEVLNVTNSGDVTSRFEITANASILILTGPASLNDFQVTLSSLSYLNAAEEPQPEDRVLQLVASDGDFYSDTQEILVEIDLINDPPHVSVPLQEFILNYVEGDGAIRISENISLTDNDNTHLTMAIVLIRNPLDAPDEILAVKPPHGANISISYDNSTGVMFLRGLEILEGYQETLQSLTYENMDADPGFPNTDSRMIEFIVFDGQKYSREFSLTLTFDSINDQPMIDLNGPEVGSNFTSIFTEDGSAVFLTSRDAVLLDIDNVSLSYLKVTIANRPDGSAEILSLDSSMSEETSSLLFVSYEDGSLFVANLDTVEDFQHALISMTYTNLADEPDYSTRLIYFVASDGLLDSMIYYTMVEMVSINDAPRLFIDRAMCLVPTASPTDAPPSDGPQKPEMDNSTSEDGSGSGSASDVTMSGSGTNTGIFSGSGMENEVESSSDSGMILTLRNESQPRLDGFMTDELQNLTTSTTATPNPTQAYQTLNIESICENVALYSKADYVTCFAENALPVRITQDLGTCVEDDDDTELSGLEVVLEGVRDVRHETIFFDSSMISNGLVARIFTAAPTNLGYLGNNATCSPGSSGALMMFKMIALTLNLTLNEWKMVIDSLRYCNSDEDPVNGTRTISFRIQDPVGAWSSSPIATVEVLSINDHPWCNTVENIFTISEDSNISISVLGNCMDYEDTLTGASIVIASLPQRGTIEDTATGDILFVTSPDDHGKRSFVYQACDSSGLCSSDQVINIIINPVNDPPYSSDDLTLFVHEDQTAIIPLTIYFGDVEDDLNPGNGYPQILGFSGATGGSVHIANDFNSTMTYDPFNDFDGRDILIFQVCDSNGVCINVSLEIIIQSVNDPPTIEIIYPKDTMMRFFTAEDTPVSMPILVRDTEDRSYINVTVISVGNAIAMPNASELVTSIYLNDVGTDIFKQTLKIEYTPNKNFYGEDSVVIEATDSEGNSTRETIYVSVQYVNDPPMFDVTQISIIEDVVTVWKLPTDLNISDPEDILNAGSFMIVDPPQLGNLTYSFDQSQYLATGQFPAMGLLTYSPPPHYFTNVSDSITFVIQACDNDSVSMPLCVNATFSLMIEPDNDAPVLPTLMLSLAEDGSIEINLWNVTSDVEDGRPPKENIVLIPPHSSMGDAYYDNNTGYLNYVPYSNVYGVDKVYYSACDSVNICSQMRGEVVLTILEVNDRPQAMDLLHIAQEDDFNLIAFYSNISDKESPQNLRIEIVNQTDGSYISLWKTPIGGHLRVYHAHQIVTYLPPPDFIGKDNFIYSVCDTCDPRRDRELGRVGMEPKCQRQIEENNNSLTDAYGVYVTCDEAHVMIAVVNVNDVPTVHDISGHTEMGKALTLMPFDDALVKTETLNDTSNFEIIGSYFYRNTSASVYEPDDAQMYSAFIGKLNFTLYNLQNDTDVDEQSLRITSAPSNGVTVLRDVDGRTKVTYIPQDNFSGYDSFHYEVCDKDRDGNGPRCSEGSARVWVTRAGPEITSLTAVGARESNGDFTDSKVSNGDMYSIIFSEATSLPPYGNIDSEISKADIDKIFTFDPPFFIEEIAPSAFVGKWLSPTKFQFKIVNEGYPVPFQTRRMGVVTTLSSIKIGEWRVGVKSAIGSCGGFDETNQLVASLDPFCLTSADGTSYASSSTSPVLVGNYGLKLPNISNVVIRNVAVDDAKLEYSLPSQLLYEKSQLAVMLQPPFSYDQLATYCERDGADILEPTALGTSAELIVVGCANLLSDGTNADLVYDDHIRVMRERFLVNEDRGGGRSVEQGYVARVRRQASSKPTNTYLLPVVSEVVLQLNSLVNPRVDPAINPLAFIGQVQQGFNLGTVAEVLEETSGIPFTELLNYTSSFTSERSTFFYYEFDPDITPQITRVEAADPTNGHTSYGNGVTLTIYFDKATNRPDISSKAALDLIFTFEPLLGNDYTGKWLSPSTLQITVLDAALGEGVVRPSTNPVQFKLSFTPNFFHTGDVVTANNSILPTTTPWCVGINVCSSSTTTGVDPPTMGICSANGLSCRVFQGWTDLTGTFGPSNVIPMTVFPWWWIVLAIVAILLIIFVVVGAYFIHRYYKDKSNRKEALRVVRRWKKDLLAPGKEAKKKKSIDQWVKPADMFIMRGNPDPFSGPLKKLPEVMPKAINEAENLPPVPQQPSFLSLGQSQIHPSSIPSEEPSMIAKPVRPSLLPLSVGVGATSSPTSQMSPLESVLGNSLPKKKFNMGTRPPLLVRFR